MKKYIEQQPEHLNSFFHCVQIQLRCNRRGLVSVLLLLAVIRPTNSQAAAKQGVTKLKKNVSDVIYDKGLYLNMPDCVTVCCVDWYDEGGGDGPAEAYEK